MKKRLLAAVLAGAMVLSMTACGKNMQKQEETQNEEEKNVVADAGIADNGLYDESCNEDIVTLYYWYLQGEIPEEEITADIQNCYGISLEEAKLIYEEHGKEFGFATYEASEEILNSKLGDQIMQIGDVVLHFPMTFGEFMEATGAEYADIKEACQNDETMEHYRYTYSLKQDFETLDSLGETGAVVVKTPDGSYIRFWIGGNGEAGIQTAKDLYITSMLTGSNNVFLAGNIHTGLSMQEIDAIVKAQLSGDHQWRTNDDYLEIGGAGELKTAVRVNRTTNKAYRLVTGFDSPLAE